MGSQSCISKKHLPTSHGHTNPSGPLVSGWLLCGVLGIHSFLNSGARVPHGFVMPLVPHVKAEPALVGLQGAPVSTSPPSSHGVWFLSCYCRSPWDHCGHVRESLGRGSYHPVPRAPQSGFMLPSDLCPLRCPIGLALAYGVPSLSQHWSRMAQLCSSGTVSIT